MLLLSNAVFTAPLVADLMPSASRRLTTPQTQAPALGADAVLLRQLALLAVAAVYLLSNHGETSNQGEIRPAAIGAGAGGGCSADCGSWW